MKYKILFPNGETFKETELKSSVLHYRRLGFHVLESNNVEKL